MSDRVASDGISPDRVASDRAASGCFAVLIVDALRLGTVGAVNFAATVTAGRITAINKENPTRFNKT
ncbi:hypothetical protein [Spirosoma aureum]|uniref:hypothetical protein n=1 Tax=Spirosoma aureum TaxID=2692134 RepID=UPI001E48BEB6|nr:hypothetical protein [Spirosoma aureum]